MNFNAKERRIGLNIALFIAYLANANLFILGDKDTEMQFFAVILSSILTLLMVANNGLFRE